MFREMRRFKQLLPQETAIEILNRNTSGTLALIGDNDYPYAVPISYVYIDGKLYFHSAKRGRIRHVVPLHAPDRLQRLVLFTVRGRYHHHDVKGSCRCGTSSTR